MKNLREHFYIGNCLIHKNKISMIRIDIKNEFSDCPGARYRKDGPHSGEEFYEEILKPRFDKALENNEKLEVILDGVWGYPSSFVSGSFGILSINYGANKVLEVIKFISEESETRKNRIIEEIKNPTKK